jgi:hypothetical protein
MVNHERSGQNSDSEVMGSAAPDLTLANDFLSVLPVKRAALSRAV